MPAPDVGGAGEQPSGQQFRVRAAYHPGHAKDDVQLETGIYSDADDIAGKSPAEKDGPVSEIIGLHQA